MKKWGPGAAIHSDYYHVCDNCEIDDGRPILSWTGKFALCYQCVRDLFVEHCSSEYIYDEMVIARRAFVPEAMRNEIYERDGYQCQHCGTSKDLCLDHIVPFAKGGKTEKDNLQALCKTCNAKKGRK